MPVPDYLTTDRLEAHRMTAAHEEPLRIMHADERVVATLGGVRSTAENRAYLERNLQHWLDHGYGIWTFFLGDQFIGRGGLLYFDLLGDEEVELNYSVVADCWGRGYATEMARAILETGFEYLQLESIVAFTLATNKGSERVMQKAGMTFERAFTHSDKDHVLYRKSPAVDATHRSRPSPLTGV